MITDLYFEHFRSFKRFRMPSLGVVNLIVGTNNSGKTTLLEALYILAGVGDLGPVWSILSRRGEEIVEETDSARLLRSVEVKRIFHGYDIAPGSRFEIRVKSGRTKKSLVGEILDAAQPQTGTGSPPQLFETDTAVDAGDLTQPLALRLTWDDEETSQVVVNMNRRGALTMESMRRASRQSETERPMALFISSSALSPDIVRGFFEDIVLTTEENLVIDALKIIEPTIERIATSGSDRFTSRPGMRGGLLVKCADVKDRIPIGSLGDGIWRMLGLALALVQAENGFLLVDEIDTGLHASVMADMWKLVYKTANRLRVQVFATTHSRDCYETLAAICRAGVSKGSDIMIHRIVRGREAAVSLTEQEIIAAAEHSIEVR
jgi:hypothetical protein